MATKMFVNLPVKDLKRSVEFFGKLGDQFDPRFSDENAACLIVGEDNFVMLLTEGFFKTFTPKTVVDARSGTEVLVSLSMESRAAVDRLVEKAFAAGGRRYKEPEVHDFMYGWGFEDPDGHIWEYFWMNPAALEARPEEPAREETGAPVSGP